MAKGKFDALAYPPVLLSGIQAESEELLRAFEFIERMRHGRQRRGMRGEKSHLSPKIIRLMAATMLANCGERRLAPPLALCDLVAQLLSGIPAAQCQTQFNREMGWDRWTPGKLEALNYDLQHPDASLREVARAVGVDHKDRLDMEARQGLPLSAGNQNYHHSPALKP